MKFKDILKESDDGSYWGVFNSETGFCKLSDVSQQEAEDYAKQLNDAGQSDKWYADRMTTDGDFNFGESDISNNRPNTIAAYDASAPSGDDWFVVNVPNQRVVSGAYKTQDQAEAAMVEYVNRLRLDDLEYCVIQRKNFRANGITD